MKNCKDDNELKMITPQPSLTSKGGSKNGVFPLFILRSRPVGIRGIKGDQSFSFKIFFIIICTLFSVTSAYSFNDSSSEKDSVKKVFPEVNVESDRIIDEDLKFTSFTKISDEVVTQIAGNDITRAITLSPGVFVQDHGGMGGLKTLSMRGMNSQQSLIMIEGMRLNSSQNGSFDLNKIPAGVFDDIQVIKGGVSALLGGNAIGGAVNMEIEDVTIEDDEVYSGTEGFYSYGSFSNWAVNSGLKGKLDSTYYGFFLELNTTDGDYPFEINEFGTVKEARRKNAAYDKGIISAFWEYEGKKYEIKNIALLSGLGGGIPGAVVQGNIENSSAEFFQWDLMIISKHSYKYSDELDFNAGLLLNFGDFNYTDTNDITHNPEMNFFTKDFRLEAGADHDLSFANLKLNTSFGYSTLVGDMLQPSAESYVDRPEFSLSLLSNTDDLHLSFGSLKAQIGIRMDAIEKLTPFYSPIAGMIYTANFFPANLKLNWSRNFRAPSFNEMYYLNYGNVNLKPERSQSWNLSLELFPYETINFSASAFLINTQDQIISIPKGPMNWSAQNMAEVESKGLEFNIAGVYDMFTYSLSYTIMETLDNSPQSMTYGKQIVYVPNELISGYLTASKWDFTLGFSGNYASHRFSLPDNSYNSMLPRHTVINSFLEYQIEVINLRFECNNLFDERYDIIKNYPMPGRSFRIALYADIDIIGPKYVNL
jgi:vitamin B12 transporter